MKATFVFADQSTISVKAFNSVKAALVDVPTKPTKVWFDYNTEDWINGKLEGFPHFQDRDKQASIKWLNSCQEQVEPIPVLQPEAKLDIETFQPIPYKQTLGEKVKELEEAHAQPTAFDGLNVDGTIKRETTEDGNFILLNTPLRPIGRPGQYKESSAFDGLNEDGSIKFEAAKQMTIQELHHLLVTKLVKDPTQIYHQLSPEKIDLWHGSTGVVGEAGELIDAIKKYCIYNKPLDRENVIEELGDLEFYMQQIRSRLGITREETLQHNYNKLNKRYEKGYSDKAAQERVDKQDEK